MTVRTVTTEQQGLGAYAEAMRARRMERIAARAAESLATAGTKATVRKQSIGFSLGKFSLDLTTQDVELPQNAPARPTAANRRTHFNEEMDAAALLHEAATAAAKDADGIEATDHTARPTADTPLTRRKALEAYAQAALDQFTVPGHIGSV